MAENEALLEDQLYESLKSQDRAVKQLFPKIDDNMLR